MFSPLRWLLLVCVSTALVRADFAQDLMRIHTEAIGGRERIGELKALKGTGVTRSDNGEMKFVLWAARPNRIRTEVVSGMRTISQGWDGASDPWIADSQTKRIIRLGGVSAWDFKIDAEFDDPLVVGSNRKISVDYVGEVEVDGRTLLKLVVVQNFTSSSFVFLDPATYMIVRRDIVRNQKGGNVVLRTEYADYRAVAGVLLPHRVVVSQGEKRIRETVIETIEPNPVLTADVFKGPADTKR